MVVTARGGTLNYLQLQTYDNIGGDAANLVRTAISQGASVIAVPNWVPDAEDEAIKAAMAAGIPVLLYNSGGADMPAMAVDDHFAVLIRGAIAADFKKGEKPAKR